MQTSSILITSYVCFFLYFLYFPWTAAEGPNITKPGCPSQCGGLTVPYPFGIGTNSGCSINSFFVINCDTSSDPPKPLFTNHKLEVLGISETKIRIKNRVAVQCFNQSGIPYEFIPFLVNLSSSSFSFSNENKLTVVGCDDGAFMSTGGKEYDGPIVISSCTAICSKPGELTDDLCSGIGCSQSSIPEGLQLAFISTTTGHGHIISAPVATPFLQSRTATTSTYLTSGIHHLLAE